jgi:serine protease
MTIVTSGYLSKVPLRPALFAVSLASASTAFAFVAPETNAELDSAAYPESYSVEGSSDFANRFPQRLIVKFAVPEFDSVPEIDLAIPESDLPISIDERLKEIEKKVQAQMEAVMAEVKQRINADIERVRTLSTGAQLLRIGNHGGKDLRAEIAALMQNNPNVVYAEVDRLMHPMATPNDSLYNEQWHYFEETGGLNLPSAWDKSDGSGVTVAVVDSGYRPHEDLNDNIIGGYDFLSDKWMANDSDGRDSNPKDEGDWVIAGACGNNTPAQDSRSSWHGTHVAGTIAALTNNSIGVAGVASKAKVLPVRVLGRCGGYDSDIIDGIVWAAGSSVSGVPDNQNPAKVINLSLGGTGACSKAFQSAIDVARSKGAVVIVSAGNENIDAKDTTPANCEGVVTVAATNRDGGRASYSNYGEIIDVSAPGGSQSKGVLSTLNSGLTLPGSDNYAWYSGTSMAAPHVSGTAALMLAANSELSPDDITSVLKKTARTFPATCSGCGTGIVDAAAAVSAVAQSSNSSFTYTYCSNERENCSFSGTRIIRYGANDHFTYKIASDGVKCTNDVFGDPIRGTAKTCSYSKEVNDASVSYTHCSAERNNCSFSGTRVVRYGANGRYKYKVATDGVSCSNDVFGDPTPGTRKACHYTPVVK